MKKLLYTYLGIGLLMLNMTSCEDFLDSSSPSEATPDFVFGDISTARGALMEAYEKWRAKAYVHANGLFYDLVVCGSDSERHPEGYDAQARHIPENLYYGGTSSFDINSAGNNGVNAWPALYSIIATCNTLCNAIEGTDTYKDIEAGTGSVTEMTDLYGQAVALRATAYHELLRFWGDVPHNLEPGVAAEGLTPRDQIYEYHINKLMQVEPYMYYLGENVGADASMMTRNYVDALIGRMCLYAGGYSTRRTDLGADFYKNLDGNVLSFDKLNTVDANNAFYGRRTDYEKFYEIAERYLQNCVDNPGTAALCTVDPRAAGSNGQAFGNPYQYVFQQNDNLVLSSESIYEIPETRGVQTERPYAFGRPSSAGGSNNYPCKNYGQSRFHPTYYYGDFDPNDMRRDVTCTVTGTDGKNGVEKLLPFVPGSQANGGGIANNKWDENRQPEPRWEKQRQSGINNPFVRMSDVILMLAEVKAELGDEVTAKQYLSEVHNRAFATPELANLDGFISKWGGIKEAIQQERKLEFGGEGLRRYDLIRTGKLPEAIKKLKADLAAMVNGLKTKGYYTFENGNTISLYVWTKSVDAKAQYGYRLTTQGTDETDPVMYPGWRGVFDDWEGYTGNSIYSANPGTNLAIQGLFKHIEPGSAEAKALEADGYTMVNWGKDILDYESDYSDYVFRGFVDGEAPIYFVPFHSSILETSLGKITNGYGFKNN
jgi:starch-binding outer membrane protein, SusD/RagB family